MDPTLRFQLNGQPVELAVDPERTLLGVLRTELGLTGTKYGCGQGLCGACTVLLNRKAVPSCSLPMREVAGAEVITIEGLAAGGTLHPLQQAFIEHDALQCGFCTPGMILEAYSLLLRNPQPSREEIVEAMEGHLCRCGSYLRIIEAVQAAARTLSGGSR